MSGCVRRYLKNWSNITKLQGETNLKNLKLEKENALLTLKDLMGISLDEPLEINEELNEDIDVPNFSSSENNADLKLLLSKKQINKIIGKINQEGLTVVPVRMYFNHKGIAKVQIAIAKGKKQHDKRHTKKTRDWEREKSRVFRKS